MTLSSEYICPRLQPQKFELTPTLVYKQTGFEIASSGESGFQIVLAAIFRDREFALYQKEALISVALTNQPAVGESAR